jgi:hypothetical protein
MSNRSQNIPDPEAPGSGRDPEDRPTRCSRDVREKMLDKTIADSFPSSDPPSTIPDPCSDSSSDDSRAA